MKAHRGLALSVLLIAQASALEPFRVKVEVANLLDGGDGDFIVEVHPEWAPIGAARFEELVALNFYREARVFRAIDRFVAQFGISGDPEMSAKWSQATLEDDPVRMHNTRGRISFASKGPEANSRTTQLFVNLGNNSFLDALGFAPVAQVVSGMDVVELLFKGYGEGAPMGHGPDQNQILSEGNEYLEAKYPRLSYITSMKKLPGDVAPIPEAEVAFESDDEDGDGLDPGAILGIIGAVTLVLGCAYYAWRRRGAGLTSRSGPASKDEGAIVHRTLSKVSAPGGVPRSMSKLSAPGVPRSMSGPAAAPTETAPASDAR